MNGQRHPKVKASHLARDAYLFWSFPISRSDSSLVLSMPTKTVWMFASAMRFRSSSSSARSSEASAKKVSGYP